MAVGGKRLKVGEGYPMEHMKQRIEISLAPMLDVTTAHFRRFVRLVSRDAVLFTEMLVSNTVVHIGEERLREKLGDADKKTVVQIGGCDPMQIAEAVGILARMGHTQFNLNCGCPSSRVQRGCFGAVLMLRRELVAEIINTVERETGAVMSLKIRTGVDEHEGFDFVNGFVSYIKENTANRVFYVHARKCWLKGLSPKQNRNIPVLDHEMVHLIKREHPDLKIVLNGSIGADDVHRVGDLDGLMIGREAIRNILVFWDIDRMLDGAEGCREEALREAVRRYFECYDAEEQMQSGHIQPMMNLLAGRRGCKALRRRLNELIAGKTRVGDGYAAVADLI